MVGKEERFLAQTLLLAEFIGGLGVIVIGLANIGGSAALTLTMALLGMFVHSIGMGVYNVHSMSTRQRLAPPEYLGRVTASYRLLSHGAIPLGAIVGGLSMDLFGGVTTMVAIGTLVSLWAVVLRFTPFMRLDGTAPTGASA
ncbi:hypothetical protein IRJ34_02020 [Paenarthrobacter sp. GOM3]|uniref:hypothetical protein n=1 Tax=Paenarthrobacter sp. GOM3 TaxID=2782567 RepID=UPI001BA7DECE|nr:hypothetical protein [Paenarthrobacter sp. GOM3]WOH19125.1 hypothetical protein IRJ34_02020 [Paenarthrobacter sp. GOM3]